MEAEANKAAHNSEASLLKATIAAWRKGPQEALRNACRAVPCRLHDMINADDGYIEK